ncbi:hypothetical protein B0181_03810 [Moraxella caviae]|uniref:Glutathione synthase/Ribosomal protein S6 modification enzyme (Glutaminyl transferase) n=1 Tax=Moraxella caviae TaxID=34060 RepID=A0A1T0A5V2_9GAMM|nr:ATP-grasp domain-containing protein [Moraxella caviae]OOR91067.1 hypothetical protein B0181_03810 [Moraxella caviae]STZ14239.1 Glutathione synthase/Ribosomal protein S6 modification enzyme (glutaminyl transferase) [Moraxella caviae]VEW13175.1 Glutathione synthase/Ribosomal protein S6 modification enzyme (glutaminyl transferase) [Moraxella caviae]
MTKSVIIVDPFSTGALYAKAFADLGYRCHAVIANDNINKDYFRFDDTHFVNKTPYSIQDAKDKLNPSDVAAVVIGAESGVIAGETLAHYFGVLGNNPATSQLRRDKFAMQDALKARGLNHIKSQIIHKDSQEFFDSESYIIKPINSAGSDGVIFIKDKTALLSHLQTLKFDGVNALGEPNTAYLLQSFITGDEFVVDMVVQGDHVFVASLCKYEKGLYNGSPFVYKNMQMLDITDKKYQAIIKYAKQCVRALDVSVGAVHMELFATWGTDSYINPVMIEMGARLHGGVAPIIFQACYEPNLLTLSMAAHLNQDLKHANMYECATQTQPAKVVFLINETPNAHLDADKFLEQIKQVDGFYHVKILDDKTLPLTVDLLSCPALVCLVGGAIDDDEKRVRAIFNSCLFTQT